MIHSQNTWKPFKSYKIKKKNYSNKINQNGMLIQGSMKSIVN